MKFPQKRWRLRSLNYIIKRCEKPAQLPGSGRPRTSRTADNIDTLNDLILRQEVASRTHKTTCQIAKENGISRSVERIIHIDIQRKCPKKRRAQELIVSKSASLIKQLISGEIVLMRVSMPKANTLNIFVMCLSTVNLS